MFMSNYTNMQYEKILSSKRLKLVKLSQVLMTVGKLFHRPSLFLSQSSIDASEHVPKGHDSHVYETESLSIRVYLWVKLSLKTNYVFFGLF